MPVDYFKARSFARSMRKEQTPAEAFFWKKVRNRRFLGKKFNRQFVIEYRDSEGLVRFFIVDFHCAEHRLIVEIDGGYHLKEVEYDRYREKILRDKGYQILRFTNEEILRRWGHASKKLEECIVNSP